MSEIIYSFLISPGQGIKKIAREKPLMGSILIVLLAIVSSTVGNLLIISKNANLAKVFLSLGLIIRIIMIFLFWLGGVALLHLFAEAWKGKGKVSILFVTFGFTSFPAIFSSPLALIAKSCGQGTLLMYIFFSLIIFLWIISLQILSIKGVYAFSLGKAILTYLTPLVIGGIITGILLILSFSTFALIITRSFSCLPNLF